MYCSHLSALEGLLNDDQIQSLESYFSNLIGGAAKNITVSKLSRALEIPPQVASRVLTKCKEIGIINVFYTIRCPECGMLIKKVDSIADIPSEPFECYGCNEEIEVEPSDIELVYALENDSVFKAPVRIPTWKRTPSCLCIPAYQDNPRLSWKC